MEVRLNGVLYCRRRNGEPLGVFASRVYHVALGANVAEINIPGKLPIIKYKGFDTEFAKSIKMSVLALGR